jgi:hypothetical protein
MVSEPAVRMSQLTWAILGGSLATVAIVWNVDTSLSPDLMIWLEPLIIVTILGGAVASEADRLGRAMLVSALVCLVKPISAPVFAYCCALLIWRFSRHAADRRRLAAYLAPATLAAALLLAANLVTSGCPFYPSPFGCTSAPWSVGSRTAAIVQSGIGEFARLSRHNQIFPLTIAAALASALCLTRGRRAYVRHCLGICWLGIAVTLIVAPVPRYGLGYFFLTVAVAGAIVVERFAVRWEAIRATVAGHASLLQRRAALMATVAAAVPFFVYPPGTINALLYPNRMAAATGDPIHIVNRVADTNRKLSLRQEAHGDLTVWVPESSDQCWDAPLPCTPDPRRDSVTLRRAGSFDQGFITTSK